MTGVQTCALPILAPRSEESVPYRGKRFQNLVQLRWTDLGRSATRARKLRQTHPSHLLPKETSPNKRASFSHGVKKKHAQSDYSTTKTKKFTRFDPISKFDNGDRVSYVKSEFFRSACKIFSAFIPTEKRLFIHALCRPTSQKDIGAIISPAMMVLFLCICRICIERLLRL